jgi:hypothetical protein
MAKIGDLDVGSVQRTPLRANDKDRISIGTITNPDDEYIDMPDEDIKALRERYKAGEGEMEDQKFAAFARQERSTYTGLLLIYLPANRDVESADKTTNPYGLENNEVVGFAVSFPGSDTAEPIEYVVNSVFAEGEV